MAEGLAVMEPSGAVETPDQRALRVLAVTNGWPTERHPEYCVFTKRQVDDIRKLGVEIDVEFINAREEGKSAYLKAIPKIMRRARDYDLVHCFHGLTFLLARMVGVRKPTVVSFLNAIDNEYIDMPGLVRPHVIRLTKRIVERPQAPYGVIVKDGIPPALEGRPLVHYVPNGINADLFRPGDQAAAREALGLDPNALYLLFVSSKDLHRKQKRYDRFCEVISAYRAAHPGKRIEELTLVAAPEDHVVLTYQAADVHVMTSDFEGSPNSVKEALATGLPVVSTDVGNVRKMIEGLAGSRVLDAFSTDAFVKAIDAVLDEPEARPGLRQAVLDQGLDAKSAAGRVIDLYRAVLAESA